MNKNTASLSGLVKELQEAIDMIANNDSLSDVTKLHPHGEIADITDESLLARCAAVLNATRKGKPSIRLVHHFACSGGTLIAKCIAALPNVYVLSEVHPNSTLHLFSDKAMYLPTDITTLARYVNIPDIEALAERMFVENIKQTHEHLKQFAAHLVLRVHSHVDYCVGNNFQPFERVSQLLAEFFDVFNIVTVRHPIDSYRSLQENKWLHFSPATFDEYCRRYIAFCEQTKSWPRFKYEDFTENPNSSMAKIAAHLQLPYDDSFNDIYDLFNLTGDSGRSGGTISSRPRRALSDEFIQEIKESKAYPTLCSVLRYKTKEKVQ